MKIYSRDEFLKLGIVIYCKQEYTFDVHDAEFEGLSIKYDTIYDESGKAVDFFYGSLTNIQSSDPDDRYKKFHGMKRNGTSEEFSLSIARDGSFCHSVLYLVYEVKDLSKFYCIIKELCGTTFQKEKDFTEAMEKYNL
jgi:hypothetical protein